MGLETFKQLIFIIAFVVSPLLAADELRQVCKESQRATTPTEDFVINTDGTVTHTKTGLTWMRCSVGQVWNNAQQVCVDDGNVANDRYDWNNAVSMVDQYSYGGHSDWRLPNIKELASIVELKCFRPAINLEIFPGTHTRGNWLADPNEKDKYSGWLVYLGYTNSSVDLRKTEGWIRLVRSPKS